VPKVDIKKVLKVAGELRDAGQGARLLLVGEGPAAAELGAALAAGASGAAAAGGVVDVREPANLPAAADATWAAAVVLVQPQLDASRVRDAVDRLRDAKIALTGAVAAPAGNGHPATLAAWLRASGLRSNEVVRDRPGGASLAELVARNLAGSAGDKLLGVAAALPLVRAAVVRQVVRATARQNGVVGALVFLPGADLPVMTLNQVRMVLRIAAAYGEDLGAQRALEILSVVGAAFGFRAVAREALDAVPVAGWALKGALGYSATLGLGRAAVTYFEAGAPLVPDKAKEISEKIDKFTQGSLGRRIISRG
jgi:uncharacterized protein (DUF697 family)